jgi:hypothetical protein
MRDRKTSRGNFAACRIGCRIRGAPEPPSEVILSYQNGASEQTSESAFRILTVPAKNSIGLLNRYGYNSLLRLFQGVWLQAGEGCGDIQEDGPIFEPLAFTLHSALLYR